MGADTPTTGSGAASESGASGRAPRTKAAGTVVPMCPLRPEDYCSQCQAYATGPQDCGLVYMVLHDPDLREMYAEQLGRQWGRRR